MLLEKVSVHTEILFVYCYEFFLIICSFSVFLENCILLPKGINAFFVFLRLYMYGFDFSSFYPDFY